MMFLVWGGGGGGGSFKLSNATRPRCVGYVYVCVAGFVAGEVGAVVLAASGVAGDEFAPWRLASYSEWLFNLHLTDTNV